MKKYKVLIVDDHRIVLDGLSSYITQYGNSEIIRVADCAKEALLILESENIDIAILDINISDLSGVELLKIIREKYPKMKVIMFSMFLEIEYISSALQYGADGYITKNSSANAIVSALDSVSQGNSFYSGDVNKLIQQFAKYSGIKRKEKLDYDINKNELELLNLMTKESTLKEVSVKMDFSQRTIENMKMKIMKKMEVRNSIGMIMKAIKDGLIDIT